VKILFDQGTPAPLRRELPKHAVATAFEKGWSALSNGDLLAKAESEFDLLVTTDQNLKYQQDLTGRRIAVPVLPTTSWAKIRSHTSEISVVIDRMKPGDYTALVW
jgi:ABC-type taurine transport system substrate-binding protein